MFCTNCGKEIPDGARFCTGCGAQTGSGSAGATAGETVRMPSSAQERSVAPASVPVESPLPASVESPLPADRHDRRHRRQAPAWAVAIAATCAVLACGGAVAAFALLGGLSATGEEPEGQVRVVAEQPGAPEPAPVEEVAAEDEPAAEPEPEPAPEPDPAPEATTSPEPAAATEAAAQDEAFWGVWIGAFSERKNAQERADLACELGFSDVRIEFSGDWAELNQAGYYVVSVGTYSSQTQAEGALSSAQRHFSDAYVKYSGAHK